MAQLVKLIALGQEVTNWWPSSSQSALTGGTALPRGCGGAALGLNPTQQEVKWRFTGL